MTIIQNSYTKI